MLDHAGDMYGNVQIPLTYYWHGLYVLSAEILDADGVRIGYAARRFSVGVPDEKIPETPHIVSLFP